MCALEFPFDVPFSMEYEEQLSFAMPVNQGFYLGSGPIDRGSPT